MKISSLIDKHGLALAERFGHQLLPSHRKALDAMLACRYSCGSFLIQCQDCQKIGNFPLSCGHRSCPQCQHHLSEAWLQRQKKKLLPVDYYLMTLTIPQELRSVAWGHQSIMYDLLFKAAVEAVKTIGLNNHGIRLAMTGVLHTHKRDKGYHPHIHLIVPGGGLYISKTATQWRSLNEKYFVNEFALATVFRGILLRMLFEQSIELPYGLPKQWVSHIKCVGRGEKALEYLSRYMYRGVINENDILSDDRGQVTFRYQDSTTKQTRTKTLEPEVFLWRLLKHVLPRGFRRVRDFGFLHGRAKLKLLRIQLLLKVTVPEPLPDKPPITCAQCSAPTNVIKVFPEKIPLVFRRLWAFRIKEVPI